MTNKILTNGNFIPPKIMSECRRVIKMAMPFFITHKPHLVGMLVPNYRLYPTLEILIFKSLEYPYKYFNKNILLNYISYYINVSFY